MTVTASLPYVVAATAVLGCFIAIDGWRRNKHLAKQDEKLEEIHVLVNSRLTEALERIHALEEALHLATGLPKEMIQKDLPSAAAAAAPESSP